MSKQQILFFGTDKNFLLLIQVHAVAARGLGPVELHIGSLNPQRSGGAHPFGRKCTSHTHGYLYRLPRRNLDVQRLYRLAYAFGHCSAIGGVATGQHHRELFSAKARHRVHGAHAAIERFGHGLQHQVACMVPIGVVDLFEIVNIEHEQQRGVARSRHDVDGTIQHRLEMPPVGQTRERVFLRELAQAINHALQILGG
ncbi:hypothetical protein NIES3787_41470 [Microcystis aeruginosa NIES-3787]|uniref:Uncharacterized protein n=1 Tax=Microcystis aeruginosa NIES-3787 TaxID=2517782 RepID=A0A6H9FYW9_MICAE|nr:hypothetical protein NIES3787_41470 [Microcystis aeruginosa NIES-3787]